MSLRRHLRSCDCDICKENKKENIEFLTSSNSRECKFCDAWIHKRDSMKEHLLMDCSYAYGTEEDTEKLVQQLRKEITKLRN